MGIESRKSVDALTESPTGSYLCFVELKSWDLLLSNKGTEKSIRKQAQKYESDLPQNWQIVSRFANRFVRIIQHLMIAGLSLSCCRIFP